MALDALVPYARNSRRHPASQIAALRASIREFGFTNPILTDGQHGVLAGHARLEAARAEGLDRVPHISLGHLPEAKRRAYVIADNRLAELAEWDIEMLRIEAADLVAAGVGLEAVGFTDADLQEMLGADPTEDAATEDAAAGGDDPADDLPEVAKVAVSRTGDLWLLGDHRLLCGDSTSAASVARVLGDARVALLFTSPPYGNQRDYTTGGISDWDLLMQGVFQHLDATMLPAGQVLVNLGLIHREGEWQPYWQGWLDWMRARGWRRFGLYTWDQGPGLPGDWNGRLAPAFELIFHFNREARQANKIIPCTWAGHVAPGKGGLRSKDGTVGEWQHAGRGVQDFRIPDNVLRITRHKGRGIETEHPAVFPVLLPEFLMRAYTDEGDAVFEPFSGSGTTILAGQRVGRRVRAIEMAPVYVDLAIARWREQHPDIPVTLDGDGRDFDTIKRERLPDA